MLEEKYRVITSTNPKEGYRRKDGSRGINFI
jgi:hypothetical protein